MATQESIQLFRDRFPALLRLESGFSDCFPQSDAQRRFQLEIDAWRKQFLSLVEQEAEVKRDWQDVQVAWSYLRFVATDLGEDVVRVEELELSKEPEQVNIAPVSEFYGALCSLARLLPDPSISNYRQRLNACRIEYVQFLNSLQKRITRNAMLRARLATEQSRIQDLQHLRGIPVENFAVNDSDLDA